MIDGGMRLARLLFRRFPRIGREVAAHVAPHQGYIDGISHAHLTGWACNFADPTERVQHEVVLEHSGEVLLRGQADRFLPGLRELGVGDGAHGFYHRLPRPLTQAEQDQVRVRVIPNGKILPRADTVATVYQPLAFVIMDIVDNCNLRCPFCLYNYEGVHKTNLMSEETIDAAVRFAPYAADGAFWYSCLHEPTMHPQFTEYLRKMPPPERRTIFYTTNLARRMPNEYYEMLAHSGVHHINVSIESRDPAIYERMRKGARHRIFMENWDILLDAFRRGAAPPKLRYIMMAYKSNVREIPSLVDYLLTERDGSEIEVRYTYDEAHIQPDFKQAEYLDEDEWLWLRDRLAHRIGTSVMLSMPPGVGEPAPIAAEAATAIAAPPPSVSNDDPPPGFLPGRYGFRLLWDGQLEVRRVWGGAGPPVPNEVVLATTNVRDIPDAEAFLTSLPI